MMLRLTALATMIVIGRHAIPLKSQVDAVKAEGHVDVVKAQGECMGTFMCTKNGGPGGASQCPCKGDCACVGGTGYGATCTKASHNTGWCYVTDKSTCNAFKTKGKSGKYWSEAPCNDMLMDYSP
jgi:hypothetical protein